MVRGLLLAGLLVAASGVCGLQATVNVFLQSSWDAAPIELEVLESLYIEYPNEYFPALFAISHQVAALEASASPKDSYAEVLDILERHAKAQSSEWDMASARASVAMHTSAPKIEAYYSYYRTAVNHTANGAGVGSICESWVELDGKGFCDVVTLRADLEQTLSEGPDRPTRLRQPSHILPFDHIYPPAQLGVARDAPTVAVLYFATFNTEQANLLFFLECHHRSYPNFRFIVRYRPSLQMTNGRLPHRNSLKGYGVEMVLKKTDYLVIDDRETGEAGQPISQQLDKRNTTAGSSSITSLLGVDPWAELATPLRVAEIEDLGLKAASLILSSSDPIDALVEVTQDFPKLSAAIARRTEISPAVATEIQLNQNLARLGHAIWINGRMIKPADSDIYRIMDIVREERKIMRSLIATGLEPEDAYNLLVDEDISQAMFEDDPMDALVDASDRPEGGGVILWWNDLEKDKKYANFPDSVTNVIRGPIQGQMAPIKRNLWNVILVLDLSKRSNLVQIYHTIKMLISRRIPVRFGLVPLISAENPDDSWEIFKLVHKGVKKHSRAFAMDLLTQIGESGRSPSVDVLAAQRLFDALDRQISQYQGASEAMSVRSDLRDRVEKWLNRVGASPSASPAGTYFFNGAARTFSQAWTQAVSQDYSMQLQYLKSNGMTGSRTKKVENHFYDLPFTSHKRNPMIVPGIAGPAVKVFDLSALFVSKAQVPEPQYIYADDHREAPVTLRILADLDGVLGQELLRNALIYLEQEHSEARLAVHHLPSGKGGQISIIVYRLLSSKSFSLMTPAVLSDIIERIAAGTWTDDGYAMFESDDSAATQGNGDDAADILPHASEAYWAQQSQGIIAFLGLDPGAAYVMVNGRLVGPVLLGDMNLEDFESLIRYESKTRLDSVRASLAHIFERNPKQSRNSRATAVATTSSILAAAGQSSRDQAFSSEPSPPRFDPASRLKGDRAVIPFGNAAQTSIRIYAVLDPLSEAAQKWSDIIRYLFRLPDVSGSIRLNPVVTLTQIPVKRFYRSDLQLDLAFDVDGQEGKTAATFGDLPGEPIFTLGMDVASSWIVSPRRSVHDLDNLRLDAITARQGSALMDVTFELERFAIEGHAQEDTSGPPRGLQLELRDLNGQSIADTQVMANLGYFQFKASPGVMRLQIRPGRGSEIYTLLDTSDGSGHAKSVLGEAEVALTSFGGLTIYPVLGRMEGMESADVLEITPTTPAIESIFSRAKSIIASAWFGPALNSLPAVKAEINIFTVASGMLYERFASIMILSVLRHTNSTVKFWFIENFLSPSFLEFLPSFAAHYGFRYEVVTYRWPSWLRAQKEKQREIWAYKILFLDVLFPMDLDKVLFVDADQIVRTDLKELVDLDLRGCVYGYAPMGDDKPEMEGFRFWKQGYWKDSLRGRPYHISALYVIDLKRFRQVAAGDRLRAQYQGLSGDPNSLANLDQDLPNSMQDTIPIFTLDKSWLWCETWCSQDSLKDAKTIDLCQNPLTKEPKLERARKIPEWDEYDQEVAAFSRSLLGATLPGGMPQAGTADDVEALAEKVGMSTADAERLAQDHVGGAVVEEVPPESRLLDEL